MNYHDYHDRYPALRMSRDESGILEVVLNTDGDSFRWTFDMPEQIAHAFRAISLDAGNRVLLLTGAGDEFIGPRADSPQGQIGNMVEELSGGRPDGRFFATGCGQLREMQNALLDVAVPVICAVNGPVRRHCELALWADVLVASEDASFEDTAHFDLQNLVPGDGSHIYSTMLLGINRARSYLLTGEVIDAHEALRLGMVAEVCPKDQALARAREIARMVASKPDFALRHARALLVLPIKKQVLELASLGLMLESMAVLASEA